MSAGRYSHSHTHSQFSSRRILRTQILSSAELGCQPDSTWAAKWSIVQLKAAYLQSGHPSFTTDHSFWTLSAHADGVSGGQFCLESVDRPCGTNENQFRVFPNWWLNICDICPNYVAQLESRVAFRACNVPEKSLLLFVARPAAQTLAPPPGPTAQTPRPRPNRMKLSFITAVIDKETKKKQNCKSHCKSLKTLRVSESSKGKKDFSFINNPTMLKHWTKLEEA